MTEPNNQPNDWSAIESRMSENERRVAESSREAYLVQRTEGILAHTNVPATLDVPRPDTETSQGILMKWKKSSIDRKTALEAIQTQYNAQLDALKYHLQKAVTVSNARADKVAKEFLMKLDSEHIEVLKDLGLRNADTRASGLIEVRDLIAQKLAEVMAKNWPKPLVDRTIDDLLDLEKRACTEMMRELGN